jgi:hypothetical protein
MTSCRAGRRLDSSEERRHRTATGDFATLTRVTETAHGTNAVGTLGATAPNAVERMLTTSAPADEPGRRSG